MSVVEVGGLTVRFRDFTAVDDVSFTVERGEIFGFLGANGAGKTTTIRVLCGLLIPTAGRVRVAGCGFEDGGDALKTRVGYMSQRFTLYNDLTVGENLDFAAALRKIPRAEAERRRRELLSFIGFDRPLSSPIGDLPGGLKQEISLAASLLHEPDVVFLDEPTAGVSPAARARFWALIRRLAGTGRTIFVTTHYMDEAEECGRIALLRGGRLIALDTPAGLKRTACPEPLLELDPGGLPADWWERLTAREPAATRRPHGRRWHVTLPEGDPARLRAVFPDGASIRSIEPTLEDVFLRLAEGTDR